MTNATTTELLTKTEVANLLKCSRRQVEKLSTNGRIPKPIYVGECSPRWIRETLIAHLESLQNATENGGDH